MRDLFRTLTEAKEVPRWAEEHGASSYTTPVEDYLEGQFEDAEADPEAETEEEQEDAE